MPTISFLKALLRAALAVALALPAAAETGLAPEPLAFAQRHKPATLNEIGEGIALVFSPDLSVPGNRSFYERLGFTYIETPSWREALRELEETADERGVRIVVVETHGTNGHGLKIQLSSEPGAARSYISVGALQQRLEEAGIPAAVISACNSGRLFRPGIYRTLDPDPEEPLFLPPTLGILQADETFDHAASDVILLRRKESNLETLMEGKLSEFSPPARAMLGTGPDSFIVSTMLIQLLLNDPALELTTEGYVDALSRKDFTPGERERLFLRFVDYVNAIARHESTGR